MTIYDLKPKFQSLLRPSVALLYKLRVTPNQITILTCLFSVIFSTLLFKNMNSSLFLNIVPLFFLLRMAMNAIDGILAKEFKLTSKLGAILNELTDIISDTFLYLAFINHILIDQTLLIIFTFCAILTEVSGLSALQIGAQRRFDGPLGKSDRAFFISFLALLLANFEFSKFFYSTILIAAITLSVVTTVNRVKKALSQV